MEINEIVIERTEHETYCGVLTYRHDRQDQLLTWTLQWSERQQVVLVLYPSNPAGAETAVIQAHYRELADAIVGTVFKPV